MCDCSKDVEDQFTCGGGGIDAFFEANQSDASIVKVFDGFENGNAKVSHGSGGIVLLRAE